MARDTKPVRRGPGRPRIPESERRTRTISIRLTEAEWQAFEDAAEKADVATRAWLRAKALRGLRVRR